MDAPSFYLTASTAWLLLQSLPLLLTPRLIIPLISPAENHTSTPTEVYLARLLALALLSIVGFTFAAQQSSIYPLTGFHVAAFVWIYVFWMGLTTALPTTPTTPPPQTTGLLLGLIGYGLCASIGIWAVVFSGAAAHVSKRTGADKRTSGWPFGNVNAYNPKVDRKQGKQG